MIVMGGDGDRCGGSHCVVVIIVVVMVVLVVVMVVMLVVLVVVVAVVLIVVVAMVVMMAMMMMMVKLLSHHLPSPENPLSSLIPIIKRPCPLQIRTGRIKVSCPCWR